MDEIAGVRELLLDRLQLRYGVTRQFAEDQVGGWETEVARPPQCMPPTKGRTR